MEKILLTNIQRFSLHDGPGIRTTVFLKGCSLRCPWCSNPENIISKPEPYIKDGVTGTYGAYMSWNEIYDEVIKDRVFYGKISSKFKENLDDIPGGVTFSGGEALLQMDKLEPLMKCLKDENIHIAVETCLFVPTEKLKVAMKYIDLFYVDMKIVNENKCREVECGDLNLYLKNLNIVLKSDIPTVIRIPVIGGYTDGRDNRKAVAKLIADYRPMKVELIKEHSLGSSKYVSLSLPVPDYLGVNDDVIEEYRSELEKLGVTVEVCKI